MTRGHRASLLLRCRAFSSLSPGRFHPALSWFTASPAGRPRRTTSQNGQPLHLRCSTASKKQSDLLHRPPCCVSCSHEDRPPSHGYRRPGQPPFITLRGRTELVCAAADDPGSDRGSHDLRILGATALTEASDRALLYPARNSYDAESPSDLGRRAGEPIAAAAARGESPPTCGVA
jgi:hypothetical protein